MFLQILLKTMLSTNEPITPTIVYYFACCVFRSRPPGPYLLSSRPLIHGAPALTHSSGGARGRPPGEPPSRPPSEDRCALNAGHTHTYRTYRTTILQVMRCHLALASRNSADVQHSHGAIAAAGPPALPQIVPVWGYVVVVVSGMAGVRVRLRACAGAAARRRRALARAGVYPHLLSYAHRYCVHVQAVDIDRLGSLGVGKCWRPTRARWRPSSRSS